MIVLPNTAAQLDDVAEGVVAELVWASVLGYELLAECPETPTEPIWVPNRPEVSFGVVTAAADLFRR